MRRLQTLKSLQGLCRLLGSVIVKVEGDAMSDVPEIRVERQAGGWVWAAIVPSPAGATPQILHQSEEAFQSEEAALRDAGKVLQKLRIQSASGGQA
jgi:hypothetical protein